MLTLKVYAYMFAIFDDTAAFLDFQKELDELINMKTSEKFLSLSHLRYSGSQLN